MTRVFQRGEKRTQPAIGQVRRLAEFNGASLQTLDWGEETYKKRGKKYRRCGFCAGHGDKTGRNPIMGCQRCKTVVCGHLVGSHYPRLLCGKCVKVLNKA